MDNPIGPIVESVIEEEDDDEDSIAMENSAMEDGDKDDNTAGETDSDPFWMKTCYICSLTCVCPTSAQVEAEAEAEAATTGALNKDSEEIVEYIINKLLHENLLIYVLELINWLIIIWLSIIIIRFSFTFWINTL